MLVALLILASTGIVLAMYQYPGDIFEFGS